MGPDIGRDYVDPKEANPRFCLKPLPDRPWTPCATEFTILYNGKVLVQPIWYSHLALLRMLKRHEFHSVLDIGANDGMVDHVFKFLGKDVTALEPAIPYHNSPEDTKMYPIDIEADFMDAYFPKKFDAIWCSHVLEHIRNPGNFLDKIYDNLKDGGVLALTVPFNDFQEGIDFAVLIGHHSKYNQLLLLYQLICAGFDCRYASMAIYQGQLSVVLKKIPNNVHRTNSALYCPFPADAPHVYQDARWIERRLYDFFPVPFGATGAVCTNAFINWEAPV